MKSWVVPGFIAIGTGLILTAVFIPTRTLESLRKKNIGEITDLTGKSTIEGLDQNDAVPVLKKTKIKNLDVIRTKAASEISARIESPGADIRILENSNILFEENNERQIILTIRDGDVLIESFGDKNKAFWIKKDGRQLTALDFALSDEKNTAQLSSSKRKKFQSAKAALGEAAGALDQGKIEEILSTKKSDFFRCYGQLIQKDELAHAHGQVLLSFEVQTSGKVNRVDISKSELQNQSFLACLKEVVLRTTFPTFNGQPVTTVFPLQFE